MAMNHFVLYRKILETIWSYGLFREPNGYHGYQPENQLIYDQGCVFRANYATLCGCNHVIRGRVTPS